MTNANDVRRAHRLVIALKGGSILSSHDADFLRSFLPELPAQKTLEELRREVYDVWAGTNGNEWPDEIHGDLETWLDELQDQLTGLKPNHPEFLETEADYQNAPEGTIVVSDDEIPWHKDESAWLSVTYIGVKDDKGMSRTCRRVLRWGNE